MPWIIADADTGHGGDAHVRNLVRRFVEVGVPGYHIEDQKPGVKKCGHQGGKVLVPSDEQIKRLNAARFQLDIMGVAGLIVARTDAEAASLLESASDERDQPFVLGATNTSVPPYKHVYLAILQGFNEAGVDELNGHLLYAVPEPQTAVAEGLAPGQWDHRLISQGVGRGRCRRPDRRTGPRRCGRRLRRCLAGSSRAHDPGRSRGRGHDLPGRGGRRPAHDRRRVDRLRRPRPRGTTPGPRRPRWASTITWDAELARTPEGYFQIRGGIPYAIAKSLAAAPFADLLWMETKTADLADAKEFADAIHAVYPDKMLAYNLSPSFNWDTTGMTEDEMRDFPAELGKLGVVFNFITYGGHQVDGMASEEFAASLQEDGMVALARLQRKFRLVDSPYKTPQTLVGGPRLDAALMGSSGRTATTKAMGKGSTQFQHLVQTEVPPKLLETWLEHLGRRLGHRRQAVGVAAAAHPGLRRAGAGRARRVERLGGRRGVHRDPRPAGQLDPVRARSEHRRSRCGASG